MRLKKPYSQYEGKWIRDYQAYANVAETLYIIKFVNANRETWGQQKEPWPKFTIVALNDKRAGSGKLKNYIQFPINNSHKEFTNPTRKQIYDVIRTIFQDKQ